MGQGCLALGAKVLSHWVNGCSRLCFSTLPANLWACRCQKSRCDVKRLPSHRQSKWLSAHWCFDSVAGTWPSLSALFSWKHIFGAITSVCYATLRKPNLTVKYLEFFLGGKNWPAKGWIQSSKYLKIQIEHETLWIIIIISSSRGLWGVCQSLSYAT